MRIWDWLRGPMVGSGWVRPLVLLGALATMAVLHIPQSTPSIVDWAVALSSGLCLLSGRRAPLTVLLLQCLLVMGSTWGAPQGGTVAQILSSVALGELAFRRPGPVTWVGVVALMITGATHFYPLYSLLANAVMVLVNVGLALLLGSFLGTQRELACQAGLRVEEIEQRRAWELGAARTAERSSIARELHDVVAHHVAAMVLRAGVARHVVPDGDPRLLDALEDVHFIAGEALSDLRRLVSVLRDPTASDAPALVTAADLSLTLAGVLDRTRQVGTRVYAEMNEEVLDGLDTVHRHAVWRIVQEGLTNVLRHAGQGASARVRVVRDGAGAALVEVSDDGASHQAPPAVGSDIGHGLMVMRERVELLGGSLHTTRGTEGWTLRATLPHALAPDGDADHELANEATG